MPSSRLSSARKRISSCCCPGGSRRSPARLGRSPPPPGRPPASGAGSPPGSLRSGASGQAGHGLPASIHRGPPAAQDQRSEERRGSRGRPAVPRLARRREPRRLAAGLALAALVRAPEHSHPRAHGSYARRVTLDVHRADQSIPPGMRSCAGIIPSTRKRSRGCVLGEAPQEFSVQGQERALAGGVEHERRGGQVPPKARWVRRRRSLRPPGTRAWCRSAPGAARSTSSARAAWKMILSAVGGEPR